MTEAEKAYAAAERKIERTIAEERSLLNLGKEEFKALTVLPPAISKLTALEALDLDGTQITDIKSLEGMIAIEALDLTNTYVSDIAPLRNMTALKRLFLNGTQVIDLRPLIHLKRLFTDSQFVDVRFTDCLAARLDTKIAQIAKIADPKIRARTLFAYLNDWQPPKLKQDTPPEVPTQRKGAARYQAGPDGKVIYLHTFDQSDDTDPAHKDLIEQHDLLREEIETLLDDCTAGHNHQFAQFQHLLDRYQAALGPTLSALNALRFWNQGNKLRRELDSTRNRSDDDLDGPPPLSSTLEDGLTALVALHNMFSATHPELSQMDQNRFDPIRKSDAPAQADAARKLSQGLAEQDGMLSQNVRDDFAKMALVSNYESEAKQRDLQVEKDSLENAVKLAVSETLKQHATDAPHPLKADLRGATIGQALTTGVGAVASSFPELVVHLHPLIIAALSCWHGADYPLIQTVEWVVAKIRNSDPKD